MPFASGKFFVSNPVTTSFTFLLDSLSVQPEVCYSLRKLRSGYAGSAIRVRRSSDNTETDIGFTTANVLDTDTLLSFVNNVSAGNGWITTWYDQGPAAPSATNLTQATATLQPICVSGGEVFYKNSKPSILYFNQHLSNLTTNRFSTYPITISTVAGISAANGRGAFCHLGAASNGITMGVGSSGVLLFSTAGDNYMLLKDGVNWLPSNVNAVKNALHIFDMKQPTGTTATSGYLDGFKITTTIGTTLNPANPGLAIYAGHWRYNSSNMYGHQSELIVFKRIVGDTDMATMRTNQVNYYGTA